MKKRKKTIHLINFGCAPKGTLFKRTFWVSTKNEEDIPVCYKTAEVCKKITHGVAQSVDTGDFIVMRTVIPIEILVPTKALNGVL